MNFKSFASLFGGRKVRKSYQHNRRPAARRERLHLEQLETRQLLSPVITGLRLRNPGFITAACPGGNSTDPTLIGAVSENGLPATIDHLTFTYTDFYGAHTYTLTSANWEAQGNFSFTVMDGSGPATLPGPYTVHAQVVDQAGSTFDTSITFCLQGPSLTGWQALGPAPVSVSSATYTTVSGTITAIAMDPRDSHSNTFYVGTDNGGIWKTTDGGKDYTPLTDYVTDPTLGNVQTPIGSLAVDPSNANNLYAGLGVATNDQFTNPGVGILKSTNAGLTWTVIGNSVFNQARISKIVVTANGTVYVAVAAGGQGPGVYRSTDSGTSWTDVMTPSTMYLHGSSSHLPLGTPLASVTDITVDTFQPENVWAGLGNIGLAPHMGDVTGGVWFSNNAGGTWLQKPGGDDYAYVKNQTMPTGAAVGRVTIALPTGNSSDDGKVYVMMGTPSSGGTGGTSLNPGATALANADIGVYKTKNGGISWTHVMLKENVPTFDPKTSKVTNQYRFVNLMTLGHEASDVGALVVDPNNGDVFYLGGSNRFLGAEDPFNFHSLLRIDTSNMRDTSYVSPFYNVLTVPNDGDDITKAFDAALQNSPASEPGKYPSTDSGGRKLTAGGYTGEGVFWYDLQTVDFGNRFFSGPEPTIGITGEVVNPSLDASIPPLQRVPDPIHALVFDGQGRLLVGTQGGVWRGVSQGFTYDVTSGGAGIEHALGTTTPSEGGMAFTDLNSNLQIADTTSVAIDPYNRHVLHSSIAATGWVRADNSFGSLQWTSTGGAAFTEPPLSGNVTLVVGAGMNPYAGVIRTGPRDPNLPLGSSSNVYRTHSGILLIAAQVEMSTDGGLSFFTAVNGLNLAQQTSAIFPALAVGPQRIPDVNGVLQDELLYWTNSIYETDNTAANWDQNTSVFPPNGDRVTVLTFGTTQRDVFWVGTAGGKVFVTFNDGADQYPERNAGLPGLAIQGITVDPNNTQIAYVMIGGYQTGKGHVFRTTNGGQTWTNITANLQDVPAYALAIDPRPNQSVAGETLYVGTAVGVFVSTNNGQSWQRLGNGMPNVAVRDLHFDAGFEKLVAGTLGRGVFQISTDRIGPGVVAISPPTPVSPGLSAVTVTFNHPVDPRTFTTAQIQSLVGPFGPITPLAVTDQDPTDHLVYQISFPAQNADGTYTLVLSPTIKDFIGNQLDQDGDGINGGADDAFTGVFALNSTDNGGFVTGAYHDLLNRGADTAGFLNTLNGFGVDPTRFAALGPMAMSMVTSPEARGYTIYDPITGTGLYPQLLGRQASSADVNYWVQQYQNGVRREDIVVALASSDEFYNNAGGTDTGFANAVYSNPALLERQAGSGEVSGVTQFLAAAETASRQGVANYLDHAPEYFGDLVYDPITGTGLYPTFLRRPAATSEINYWVTQLQSGLTTNEGIVDNLVASDEYFKNPLVVTPDTPNGTDGTNPTWIKAIYNDLLHRSPDPGGFNFLLGQLQAGMSRAQVAHFLINSDEYHRDLIYVAATGKGYFPQFLQRAPSPSELTNLATAMDDGVPDEAIISYLVSTPEYFGLHAGGATTLSQMDVNFVKAAYQDLLTRPADNGGLQFLTQRLDQAEISARAQIVGFIVTSDEYLNDLITDTYQADLGRAPASSEEALWRPVLRQPGVAGQPNGDEILEAAVLSSQEYFYLQRDSNGLAEDGQWLQSVWSAVLTRTPDATSFNAGLTALLNAYQPQRLAVSSLLVNSAEYDVRIATTYYTTYLRRAISPAELTTVVGELQSGLTHEQLIANLVSLTEYFSKPNLGGSNNSIWLNQIYLDLLGRNIDSAAEAYWLNQLNTGTTRLQVAMALLVTDEYRHRLIDRFYTTYLGRAVSDAEFANWSTALKKGTRDEQIIAALVASNDYLYQAQTSGGPEILRSHPFP